MPLTKLLGKKRKKRKKKKVLNKNKNKGTAVGQKNTAPKK